MRENFCHFINVTIIASEEGPLPRAKMHWENVQTALTNDRIMQQLWARLPETPACMQSL